MGTQTNTIDNLSTYVVNNAMVADLEAKIEHLNNRLTTIDANIKLCELMDAPHTADRLAQQYNQINRERIILSLKLNKLERESLLFELNSTFRD